MERPSSGGDTNDHSNSSFPCGRGDGVPDFKVRSLGVRMIYLLEETGMCGGIPTIAWDAVEDGEYAKKWLAKDPEHRSFKPMPEVKSVIFAGPNGPGLRHP